jgi:hypothetical protein
MMFLRHKVLADHTPKSHENYEIKPFFLKDITCPDGLSKVCHTAPVWPSLSTGTVTEPRTALFQIISQS